MGDLLTEKMIRDIKTKGLSESTVRSYLAGLERFRKFIGKDLETVEIDDIQIFHLHLIEEEKLAPPTVNLYMAGVRFFYLTTLQRNWNPKNFPHTKVKRVLPMILSPEKVLELFEAVESPKYRALLMTIYSAGLRVNEAVNLAARDILSDRMQIHIRCGKGGKERYSVLSEVCLDELRRYWKATPAEEKKNFLFPGADSSRPIDPSSVRKVLTEAKLKIGIEAKIRVHSLRHCFGTHLLENGVDLRVIQLLLGHASISSTTIYTHLRDQRSLGVKSPLDVIVEKATKKAS